MARKPRSALPVEPLADLLAWWEQCGVRGMIIGGLAVALRSKARTTVDVDAIVLAPESAWPAFLKSGRSHHFTSRMPDPLSFAQTNRMLLLRHVPSGKQVDMSLGSLPFEEEAVGRATILKLQRLSLPVATVEDLIILKAVARRSIDYADIINLLDINPEIDREMIRRHVEAFAQALEAPEVFTKLDELLAKKRTQKRRSR